MRYILSFALAASALTLSPLNSFAAGKCHELYVAEKQKREVAPLFSQSTVVRLSLKANFKLIKDKNAGGNWSGEDRSAPEHWTTGELNDLSNPSQVLPVQLRGRGMSSADDVAFNKLRLKIEDSVKVKGTVFEGSRGIRINAHNDTHPTEKVTPMGRLNDERAPYREALAYEIIEAMGVATPRIRRASIDYTDTSTGEKFTRKALLVEADKRIAEKYEAEVDSSFPETNMIPINVGARFHLSQILIGNQDFGLKLKNEISAGTEVYRPFFNTLVLKKQNGEQIPVAYDLDMAALQTGRQYSEWKSLQTFGAQDAFEAVAFYELAGLRARMSKNEFAQALKDFDAAHSKINEVIKRADVDPEGRAIAQSLLSGFARARSYVENYLIVRSENLDFVKDPMSPQSLLKEDPIDGGALKLRAGTVFKILDQDIGWTKIAIVDAKYDLASPMENIGYVRTKDFEWADELPTELQGKLINKDMTF